MCVGMGVSTSLGRRLFLDSVMIVFLIRGNCHIVCHLVIALCTPTSCAQGLCILYILADSVWLFAFLVVAVTMDIRHHLIDLYFPIG